MLDWRTVTHSQSDRFLVKGSELSNAMVPNTLSRFQICEIRTYNMGWADRRYAVRDAQSVSDADVRNGVRPHIVAWFDSDEDAVVWCQNSRYHYGLDQEKADE